MGRALADSLALEPRFRDPTAMHLLPEEARARVERARARNPPDEAGLSRMQRTLQRSFSAYLHKQSALMVARSVAIDDVIREASAPQLVLLGAGLDGRAFRMPELGATVVFEVDHPDSQRDKRARLGTLDPCAREVRFAPVDFERDSLEVALQAIGHDATQPTTWIWEGVVMYLSLSDIESTLEVVASRSMPGSRLVVVYHSPALVLRAVSAFVRLIGEPLRSVFTPAAMAALLERYGFAVQRDCDIPGIGATLSRKTAEDCTFAKHIRVADASRTSQ